jgi:site-specific DNA-cytosine methylase
MHKKKTVLDCFHGPGALGTAFEQYFDVPEAIDNNRDASETYQYNHPYTRVHCRDIRDLDFGRHDFEGIMGVVGGPPCQGHSVLNLKRGTSDARNDLMYEMLRAIMTIQPRFCLIENVASIPFEWKRRAIDMLREHGYKVVSKTIFAADYGSVQLRRRWILTGCLDRAVFPEMHLKHRVAGEILTGQLSEITATPEILAAIQALPTGKWVALPGQQFKVYYVIDPLKPLPAVVNPTKLRYVRPDRQGYLSMEELYRAQGFPPGYKFFGTLTSRGQQLANAVPVELAAVFAKAFYTRLN